MILIFGSHNSRYTYTGSLCPHNDLAYEIEASQIKDAIRLYEEKFNVKITTVRRF